MEPERPEVYERIPWETLERGSRDRNWIVYAVAGAVTLGALTYSFMRSQPEVLPPATTPTGAAVSTVPATTAASNIGSLPESVESPVVVAEADLYAVDPQRLAAQAASHAEWFAVEYIAVDGTDKSREQLAGLLPTGVPLPEAPEGTQVFVDWAGATSVTETEPGVFRVAVLVRSLLSNDEQGFERQSPVQVEVDVVVGDDGQPRVASAPSVQLPTTTAPVEGTSEPVPEEIAAELAESYPRVVGGVERPDGGWDVVVMGAGADGVLRPMTVSVP